MIALVGCSLYSVMHFQTITAVSIGVLLAFAASLAVNPLHAAQKSSSPGSALVYIGTYTGPKSKGIYLSRIDLKTGALSPAIVAAETASPSFLAVHPNRRFLYAVGEISNFGGKAVGAVSAFAIDPESGKLTLLNQESSQGAGPCHLVVDKEGKHVLVANYGGGSATVLPIGEDGRIRKASSSVQHTGSSVNPQRQKGPHAHSINLDGANRFAVVADLGLDKVLVYKFDSSKGTLEPNDPPHASVAPGAGPRHFAFHPNGKLAYVINELHSTVTAFSYDADRGILTEIGTVPTLPEPVPGNSTAEVVVHPSGKFLYGSNRGHNSIAVFTIDQASGKLTPVEHESTQGKTPRNFAIDPTGTFLLAENQGSDTIVVFKIDPTSGALDPTGHTLSVPSPVCVKFLVPGR